MNRDQLERELLAFDEGVKLGTEEGMRAAWRKLFWLIVAASFVGSLLSISAIFITIILK